MNRQTCGGNAEGTRAFAGMKTPLRGGAAEGAAEGAPRLVKSSVENIFSVEC